jgi:hypothetical protein
MGTSTQTWEVAIDKGTRICHIVKAVSERGESIPTPSTFCGGK